MIFISTGILIGSLISLLVSRYLFYNFVKKNILTYHRNFIAIDAVIAEEGWRTVFLLRLTPFPFGVVSYLLGITSVKLKDYFIGTLSVILHVIVWIYIGQTIEKFSEIEEID